MNERAEFATSELKLFFDLTSKPSPVLTVWIIDPSRLSMTRTTCVQSMASASVEGFSLTLKNLCSGRETTVPSLKTMPRASRE